MFPAELLVLVLVLFLDWWKNRFFIDFDDHDHESVEVPIAETSDNLVNDIQWDEEENTEDLSGSGCSKGIYEYLVFAFWMCLVAGITASCCRARYKRKLLDISIHHLLQDYEISDIFKSSPELQRYSKHLPVQSGDLVNQLVDLMLMFYKQNVIGKWKKNISAPDLEETFQKNVVGFNVTGTITTRKGLIGDLSTVRRTSSFHLNGNLTKSDFTLFGSLGLLKLEVKYKYYRVAIFPFDQSGSLIASVDSSSIYIEVTASLKGLKCLKIKNYDIQIKASEIFIELFDETGVPRLDLSGVVNLAIKMFKLQIVDAIEKSLRQVIDKQLRKMRWKIPLPR